MQRSVLGFAGHVLPALLYVVALFVAGTLPQGPEPPFTLAYQDKILHLVGFGGLGVLAYRALRYAWPRQHLGRYLSGSVLSVALAGGLLELWQGLIPTRQADAVDFLADVLGGLLVAVVLWRWAAPREKRAARRGAASGRKLAQRRSEP